MLSVSAGSIQREKPPGQANADKASNTGARTSEPAGQELLYAARVALESTRIQIEDRVVELASGMAVTVEIKTGQQSASNFLHAE